MKTAMLARHPVGNPTRKWRQDYFIKQIVSTGPLPGRMHFLDPMADSTRRKARIGVRTVTDAGFNMISTLWANSDLAMDIVRTAEAEGANVVFQDMMRFGGMGNRNIYCKENDYIGAIEDTRRWKCIKGYCLWDEPILPEHMEEVRKMIDYVDERYPDILPYTVANPDYHPLLKWDDGIYEKYISDFINTMNPAQMHFDYYPIGKDEFKEELQLDNSTMWSCLELIRRKADARSIPMWFAYQGQRYPWHNVYYSFKFPMARAMANAGILHGVKALECYIEFTNGGVIDAATGGHGTFFDDYKEYNKELSYLGNTLMALRCLRVIHDDTLLPEHLSMHGLRTPLSESEFIASELPKRISISEHSDKYGNKYLMILNRDYNDSAHISLDLKGRFNVYEVSKADGAQYLRYENEYMLSAYLKPGELMLYRMQRADEEPFAIEYYLDK